MTKCFGKNVRSNFKVPLASKTKIINFPVACSPPVFKSLLSPLLPFLSSSLKLQHRLCFLPLLAILAFFSLIGFSIHFHYLVSTLNGILGRLTCPTLRGEEL
ncbi:hypothetical protein Nepgr_013350 [Nepenthes gracilis]|uniref:Transmembrane protein n=1 Tax=Nepenthes gracilis TaxID=150966 RepID=A0AAD3SJ18_NEPGR|nr:hypothetical protein Nepgr_013350 [Nepenthes gracilis]